MKTNQMSLLTIPICVLSLEDFRLSSLDKIEDFKMRIKDATEKEKFKLSENILSTIRKIIDQKINGSDAVTGISNREFTSMSTAPSFMSRQSTQEDVKRFITSVRLSDHIEYFNLLNDAFNIETIFEIHYKVKLGETDLMGVPPFECSYRTFEDSNMRHISVTLNIHEGDMSQIERGIELILDGIHEVFHTIFSDITEDHTHELRSSVQDNFTTFLKTFTGKDNPNADGLDSDAVQDIYYFTLLQHAVKFYRAREEYNRILGMQVEPQNILSTKKAVTHVY